MDAQAESLLRQYSELRSRRGTWDNQWQTIADYGLGRRNFTTNYVEGGRPRQTLIFDATFQQGADSLAAALQSLLVNAAARWFELKPEDTSLLEYDEVKEWFTNTTDRTYWLFNHPEANFGPQIHETLLDIVAFGTGAMYIEDVPQHGIVFSSRPLGEIYVSENAQGRIDTVYRKFMFSSRQATELWGDDAGDQVKVAYDNGKYEQLFEFCHAVLPRRDVDKWKLSNRSLPYASFYINVTEKEIISERGYHELPYQVARWSKDSGELYGRGPGYNAIPDAKMLNRMSRTMLVAAEKAADPPLLVSDDGVISPVRTQPGGINVVRSGTGRMDPLQYLESRARTDLSQERFQAVREQVRGHFYHELLQTFDDPRMTATQVLELASRTAQRIGPMIFRLQTELLEPIVERVVGIALRKGLYLPPPAILEGTPLRVDYVSPAARAQLNADVQGILGLTSAVMQWSQMSPDTIDNVDFDKASRELAQAFGNTSKILRPNAEMDTIRDARAQAAQDQEGMQQAAQMAQIADQAGIKLGEAA